VTINNAFNVGQTLSATECNNLPFGLAENIKKSETTDTFTTADKQMLQIVFTAVAGRNYLITFIEPNLTGTAATTATYRFRDGGSGGGILQTLRLIIPTLTAATMTAQYVFVATSSGSQTITVTANAGAGTVTGTRSSTQICNMWVTDIGIGYEYAL
jgi:hypothetical protein